MEPEETRKYAQKILMETLTSDQWACIAFLVNDDYPIGKQARRGFLERLSKLEIRRSQK